MAEKDNFVDLTLDDDDTVSIEERKWIQARIQAKSDAKLKDDEKKQELAKRRRAIENAENLNRLNSGTAVAMEVLSDEEQTSKTTHNGPQNRMNSGLAQQSTPKKHHARQTSIPTKAPTKTEGMILSSPQKMKDAAKSSPLLNNSSNSTLTTSHRVQIPLSSTLAPSNPIGNPRAVADKTSSAVPWLEQVLSSQIPARSSKVSTESTPGAHTRAAVSKNGIITTERESFPLQLLALEKDSKGVAGSSTVRRTWPSGKSYPPLTATAREHETLMPYADQSPNFVRPVAHDASVSSLETANQSSVHKMGRKGSIENRKIAQEHSDAKKKTIPRATGFSTIGMEAESNILPTPALTPASLYDHTGEVEKSAEEDLPVTLHVNYIESVLQKHERLLHEDQEALVKQRLGKAQELHQSSSSQQRNKPCANAFQDLLSRKRTGTGASEDKKHRKFVIQTSRIIAKAGSKATLDHLNVIHFVSDVQLVPKVKSIGRLGVSRDLLARNVRTLTHMPWFPENEIETATGKEQYRYEELHARYVNDIQSRSNQRRCRAIGSMWAPKVMELLAELSIEVEDVLYYMLHDDEMEKPAAGTLSPEMEERWYDRAEDCPGCANQEDCRSLDWRRILRLIKRPPTERRLAMAGLLCEVFYRMVQINLWHIVSDTCAARVLQHDCLLQLASTDQPSLHGMDTFCYACGQYSCTAHGAYIDEDELENSDNSSTESVISDYDNNDMEQQRAYVEQQLPCVQETKSATVVDSEVVLDDPGLGVNTREYAALPVRQRSSEMHNCGVFCFDGDVSVKEILGQQSDGSVSGVARMEVMDKDPPAFDDSTLCESEACFWNVAERRQAAYDMLYSLYMDADSRRSLFGDEEDLCQSLLPYALKSKRGPCELALAIPDAACLEIFYFMLCSFRFPAHSDETDLDVGNRHEVPDVNLSNDKALEDRKAFVPCAHEGPCHINICTCAMDKISCESNCGCTPNCGRRFRGCNCRNGRRKVCFEDARCDCWSSQRECDPALCAGCGVEVVLDPLNRSRQDLDFYCRNNRIQLGIPKRTLLGISEVHGWGLYAGEAIAKSEFISEYKGELISILEGNRRGAVYHNLGLEYLFKLSKNQELDGSRVSNKARFINNSSLAKNINVLAKKLLCNGVSRIMLYAIRDIAAGEELFYDYGYHKLVRANFKEKPDSVKKSMLPPALSTTPNFGTRSIAKSTVPSVHSDSRSFENEYDSGGYEDAPVLPTSEHDSEFEMAEDATEEFSSGSEQSDIAAGAEESDDSDAPLPVSYPEVPDPHTSPLKSRPGMHVAYEEDLSSSSQQSPKVRPKKRLRLSQPRPPVDHGCNSDIPPGYGSTSHYDSKTNSPLDDLGRRARKVTQDEGLRSNEMRDKRFGGASQRKAAETLRRRREAECKAFEQNDIADLSSHERKRTEPASSPNQEASSSQPLLQYRLSHPKGQTWPRATDPPENYSLHSDPKPLGTLLSHVHGDDDDDSASVSMSESN